MATVTKSPYPTADWAEHRRVSGESFHLSRRQMDGVFHFATHGHLDYFELVLVMAGRLTHLRPGLPALVDGPGCLRLMRPGDIHGLEGRDLVYVNLAFPAVWIDRLATLWEDGTLARRLQGAVEPPVLTLGNREMKDLAGKLEGLLAIRFGVEGRRIFSDILGWVLGKMVTALPLVNPPTDLPDWLGSVSKYIEDNLSEELSPGDLAERVGVSAAHFSRAFHKHFGMAPTAWLIVKRLERAANLLAGTNDPVTRVALASGFSDPGHFTRSFHRRYGAAPVVWRKKHQEGLRSSALVGA